MTSEYAASNSDSVGGGGFAGNMAEDQSASVVGVESAGEMVGITPGCDYRLARRGIVNSIASSLSAAGVEPYRGSDYGGSFPLPNLHPTPKP